MIYQYKCVNTSCEDYNKIVEINLPVKDSDKKMKCKKCECLLQKVFSSFGLKTSDGFKQSRG